MALADVNADGLLDLATGGWWENTRIFRNTGFGLAAAPGWNSAGTSVVEKIVFGDVDPPCGLDLTFTETFPADGGRQLFYLPHMPVQGIVTVRRDGVELGPADYTFSREAGWVVVNAAPLVSVEVVYTYSRSLDMTVSNWDGDIGNFLYYNLLYDDCNDNHVADGCDIVEGTESDFNGNGVPDSCEGYCPWDLDGSGDVGVNDFLDLLAVWGTDPGGPPDFDGDGTVGVTDFLALLAHWGPCP